MDSTTVVDTLSNVATDTIRNLDSTSVVDTLAIIATDTLKNFDSTVVESVGQTTSISLDYWIPIAAAVIGSFLAFVFTYLNEKRKNKKERIRKIIGALVIVHKSFDRNRERLEQFIDNFTEISKEKRTGAPTMRLITSLVEENIIHLIYLNNDELLKCVIRTYEEHTHINRRWDYLYNACQIITEELVKAKLENRTVDEFGLNYEDDISASNNVLKWTNEDLKSLEDEIQKHKKQL